MAENETTEVDKYDSTHGDPAKGKDMPAVTQDQAWGESLNPVRNPAPPFTNVKKVGGVEPMAIPFQLQVVGSISAIPYPGGPAEGQSLQEFLNLGQLTNPTQRSAGVRSLIAAVDEPLDFGSVTAGTFLALRVLSGSLSMKVTTPLATDQVIPCGGQVMLYTPNPGQQITAVTLSGTADFQFILCGN